MIMLNAGAGSFSGFTEFDSDVEFRVFFAEYGEEFDRLVSFYDGLSSIEHHILAIKETSLQEWKIKKKGRGR